MRCIRNLQYWSSRHAKHTKHKSLNSGGRFSGSAESQQRVQALLAELKACSRARNLQSGKQVHAKAVECGHDSNVYVASTLVSMYAKCGSMADAFQVFSSMRLPPVVSWNALILGYAENGEGDTALLMFTRMRTEVPELDSLTFVATIKACTALAAKGEARSWGRAVHNLAVENACDSNMKVQNTLVDMYANCRSMVEARRVFETIKHPNVVSWTALILGYADNGEGHTAFNLFNRMKCAGLVLDALVFVAGLKACTSIAVKEGASRWRECRERGEEMHHLAVKSGCDSDIRVVNTLIDMYAKCGCMGDARQAFDTVKRPDVVSWTVLILGYAENGNGLTALDLFMRMKRDGPAPSAITIVAALKACISLKCRDMGRQVHEAAVETGNSCNIQVQATLMDMYAKCGSMIDAHLIFDSMKHQDVVSWNVLIMGYAENGKGLTALNLFKRMRTSGLARNSGTFGAALKACGIVGGLEFGRTIHSEMDRTIELDVISVTCLVDFYAKCGCLEEARRVFDSHSEARNVVTWTALLSGYSSCGDHESVFGLFERMQDAAMQPNPVTLLSVLACCSHAGLVEKGKECFDAMSAKHEVVLTLEHYTCMVDMFARANQLDDAMALLNCMLRSADDVIWRCVLGACCKWRNLGIGWLAFETLIGFSEEDAGAYILLGQIYETKGMLQEQRMVNGLRSKLKASRAAAAAEETCWTNEHGEVHAFS